LWKGFTDLLQDGFVKKNTNPFKAKFLQVTFAYDVVYQGTIVISNPSRCQFEGVEFIKGEIYTNDPKNYLVGRTMFIALNQIKTLVPHSSKKTLSFQKT
jgi:hypothetical protein